MKEIQAVEMKEGSPRGDREKSVEVSLVAQRRRHSSQYKLRILDEVDRAGSGEIGLILRREGLYSSYLAKWREWRSGMNSKKQGKKTESKGAEFRRLEKENAKLKLKLAKAVAMLDLQKKASAIWELADEQSETDS